MLFLKGDNDLITAPITAPGVGAISVIRVSGSSCFQKTKALYSKLPEALISHKVYLCSFIDPSSGEKIDQVLLTYFKEGASFTGEETLEISCHGSVNIVSQILEILSLNGVRLAEKGEFTYRAFMNGKLNLTQAEGMLQLINSKNTGSRRLAMRHFEGHFGREVSELESKITWCLAHIEAGIDFSHEPISVADQKLIVAKLIEVSDTLKEFLAQAQKGKIIREGLNVLLVGEPNVGKSSLLNFLSQTDRALVSETPGTTRDFIECRLSVGGFLVNLIDSAGIHDTQNSIEIAGILKTQKLLESSDLIIVVFDLSKDPKEWNLEFLSEVDLENCLIVLNKSDRQIKSSNKPESFLIDFLCKKFTAIINKNKIFDRIIKTNTVEVSQRGLILEALSGYLLKLGLNDENFILTQRQSDAFSKALNTIEHVTSELQNGVGPELIAFDLKEGLVVIQQLLGKHFDDQVLDKVFKEFCLGK